MAWANGPGSTGGGNAIVCFDDPKIAENIRNPANPAHGKVLDEQLSHIASIEMYDLHDAENGTTPEGKRFQAIEVEKDESREHYIHRLRDRMYFFIPEIGNKLWTGEQTLPSSHIRIVNESLPPTNDVLPDSDGKPQCALIAMAIHTREGRAHLLKIDGRLFNHPKHSPLSQNILFLHEYLYSVAMEHGKTDSRAVRNLIGRVIVQDGVMLKELESLAADLGFLKPFDFARPWEYPPHSYAMCRLNYFFDRLFDESIRLGFDGGRMFSERVANWMKRARALLKKQGRLLFGCARFADCEDELRSLGNEQEAKALLSESEQFKEQLAAKQSLENYYQRRVKSLLDYIPGITASAAKTTDEKIQELLNALARSLERVTFVETPFDSQEDLRKNWPIASEARPYTYAIWGWTDYAIPPSSLIPPVKDNGLNPKLCFWPEE